MFIPERNSLECLIFWTYLVLWLQGFAQPHSWLVVHQGPTADTPLLGKPLSAFLLLGNSLLNVGQAILISLGYYPVIEGLPTQDERYTNYIMLEIIYVSYSPQLETMEP